VKQCESLGLLLNAPSEIYLRIAPALNISMKQAEQCVNILQRAITEVKNG
jgi:acetylornithine aminotransferase